MESFVVNIWSRDLFQKDPKKVPAPKINHKKTKIGFCLLPTFDHPRPPRNPEYPLGVLLHLIRTMESPDRYTCAPLKYYTRIQCQMSSQREKYRLQHCILCRIVSATPVTKSVLKS